MATAIDKTTTGGGFFSHGAGRELPVMCSVDDVAALLACSSRHVYRLVDRGRMPRPVKLGALIRWPRSTGNSRTGILDWIAAGCPDCRRR